MKEKLLGLLSWANDKSTKPRSGKKVKRKLWPDLLLEQLESRTVLSAVPVATLTAPATPLIGTTINLSVDFKNASPTDTGYGAYVDVILPSVGHDGNDGITFTGTATYLGAAVKTTVLTFDASGHATHPYAIDPSTGQPLIVDGTPGDELVVFQLPFGSFTPGQPDVVINFTANVSNLANLNYPLTIQTDGGFQYGNSPTGTTSVLGARSPPR